MYKKPLILAIESSCDDTAAAVINGRKILSNCVANQKIHIAYGGVVPELASRAHQSKIIPVVQQALQQANINKKELTAIAYTQGPGLLGSLLVGSAFAKSLSLALNIPLIPINHIQGHLLVHFIEDERIQIPSFPFLGVILSGGHTQLVDVRDHFNMNILGTTLDDAIGEAFDKCGKKMGLDYPSGPLIDQLSKNGNSKKFTFPVPKVKELNVSYSGCKTAFINFIEKEKNKNSKFIDENLNDLCSSIQLTLIKIITQKIEMAVQKTNISSVVIGGGVSANSEIRNFLRKKEKNNGWSIYLPSIEFTTDNAAMVGVAGYYKFLNKKFSDLSSVANPRMSF